MAFTAISSVDSGYISANPASNASLSKIILAASLSFPYSIPSLSRQHFHAAVPLKKNAIITSVSRSGNNAYNELVVSSGLSKSLGRKIKAGVKLSYMQWRYGDEQYADEQAVLPEAGIIIDFYKGISFGCQLINFRSLLGRNKSQNRILASTIISGIAVPISKEVTIAVSAIQNDNYPLTGGIGCEYKGSRFALRCGIKTTPFSPSFGFCFLLKRYRIDSSCMLHPQLGNSIGTSISFSL